MTSLAELHPAILLGDHLQVIQHAIRNDPRKIVLNFALLSAQELIGTLSGARPEAFASVMDCVAARACDESSPVKTKYLAIAVMERWCRQYALDDATCEHVTKEVIRLHRLQPERFGPVSARFLATIAQRELAAEGGERLSRTSLLPAAVQYLLEFLHPDRFRQSAVAWGYVLESLGALCQRFPNELSAYTVSCLVELLENDSNEMKQRIFKTLSRIALLNPESVATHVQVLLRELSSLSAVESSNDTRAALAVTLFRVLRVMSGEGGNAAVAELEQALTSAEYASQADRYEMAKVAMTHGYFRLGLALTTEIAAALDNECFGGWLRALCAINDAEASVTQEGRVGLNSIYQLSRATMYLNTASTSRFKFEFQLQTVELRAQWMKLVLQAQQFAGETEYGNVKGASREEALRDRFLSAASQYHSLRSTMIGASVSVMDAVDGHARICELLAAAIDGFLLLRSPPLVLQPACFSFDSSQSFLPATSMQQTCAALEADIHERAAVLQRIDASRRATLGGKVMQQLLQTVCSTPFALSQQFFRLAMKLPERRIVSNVQFLTVAENTTFTAKPRPRSQLGVPFGTDFNSLMKGVLEIGESSRKFWQDTIHAIDIEVRVHLANKTGAAAPVVSSKVGEDSDCIKERIVLDWTKAVSQRPGGDDASVFLAFETPVHVRASSLRAKGSFQLQATVSAVDARGTKWQLSPTGCARGFIVY